MNKITPDIMTSQAFLSKIKEPIKRIQKESQLALTTLTNPSMYFEVLQ